MISISDAFPMNSLFKYPSLTVTSPCASESGVIAFM